MKKLIILMLTVMTLGVSSATAAPVVNAQSVWVDYSPYAHKYHYNNPGREFGKGKVNHHWHKVSLSWAKSHHYERSLR